MSDTLALAQRLRKLEATLEALAARERLIAASGGLLNTGVVYVTSAGTLTTEAPFAYIEGSDELRVGRARLAEQATPTTPASGFSLLFAGSSGDNNGVASSVDDAGVVYQMVRYATGTFTPTYFGASTAGVTTYAASGQVGAYVRVGNTVFFNLYVNWTNATGTGNALIGGLPFTSRNTTNLFGAPSLLYNALTYAAGNGIQLLLRFNTSQLEIYNAPASNTGVAAIAVEAGGEVLVEGTYFV